MKPREVYHPIQAAIEDVYAAGHTPRLQLDARRRDVIVPDFIRRTWQARLVIDLDPSYPLDLAYEAAGIGVDLAFQGQVSRCTLSWESIYAVIDRSTGRGVVVEAHLPPAELAPEQAWVDHASKRPKLSAVPVAQEKAGEADEAPPPEERPREDKPREDKPREASSDEAAKARRARFKVIDGGR
jgi:stringent starvation protein B